MTKLSLSTGRCILRPQYETELTIQDRTPGLFTSDMIEHYDDVFPSLLEKKKAQADRVLPYRKRTALVDQRISRSDLARDVDPQELLAQQAQQKRGSLGSPVKATMPAVEIPSLEPEGEEFKTPLGTPAVEPSSPLAAPSVPTSIPSSIPTSVPVASPVAASPVSPVAAIPAVSPVAVESPVEPPAPTSGRTTPSRSSVHSVQADDVIAPGGGLKRNTSSEASRLRGPKGARGPRPAPGHGQRGSVSKIAAQFENGGK